MFNLFKKSGEADTNVAEPAQTPAAEQPSTKPSWAERLKQGLAKTSANIGALFGSGKIDEALYEELETSLLVADCGVAATQALLDDVRNQVSRRSLSDAQELRSALKQAMQTLLTPLQLPLETNTHHPFVIMLVGVNGAGKTTTIGKLAKRLQSEGKSVLIAAGDTFRAAAREQLQTWGERNNVHVVVQEGADPAAVIFDAVNSAKAKQIDVVIADTAGRLPTQMHLMEEIKKVQRVIGKALPDAPHEVLLVLDANTGQNAVMQVQAFDDALNVTGLVLTKLDGTAKGGVIAAIARTRPIPVRFIGVGEQIDDLQPFKADEFSEALFS